MTINRDLILQVLKSAFPDPRVAIGVDAVEAMIDAMQASWQPAFEAHFGVPRGMPRELGPQPIDGDARADFYLGHARHSRVAGEAQHTFEAHLPLVRFSIPETLEDVQTAGGWAYAGDRLLHSMSDVRAYLHEIARHYGSAPEIDRVDLVTPPRLFGSRFGAFSVYMLMRDDVMVASILEAGMATGEPRVLYWIPTLGEGHVRRSWFAPTPDSNAKNFYRGTVHSDGDAPGEPDLVVIERFTEDPRANPAAVAIMVVRVQYEKLPAADCTFPGELLLQAACRVAAVADAMGRQMPDIGALTPVLAEIGRNAYPWIKEPAR